MSEKKLRIVFMGTPEFAVATLQTIVDAGWSVVGVVTAPDKPAGRGLQERPSPVKLFAQSRDLPILQPLKLRDPEFLETLRNWKADLQVVVAFRMLPEIVWSMPAHGSINLHASLLPAYRGAAPINRAIMQGETKTGLSTFFLQHAIDTGDLLDQVSLDIGPEETAGALHDRMMVAGASLVLTSLNKIEAGQLNGIPQIATGEFPHAAKIFKEDCQIRWDQSSQEIHNHIRGLSPHPAAWTLFHDKMFKIYRSQMPDKEKIAELDGLQSESNTAGSDDSKVLPGTARIDGQQLYFKTAEGWIEVTEVQWEGKKRMATSDFLRGFRS